MLRRLILALALLAVPLSASAQINYPPRAPVGVLVKKAADQLALDASAGVTIAWDAETYDQANFHDNVTNNTRITIPAGVNRVQCGSTMTFANNTIGADVTLIVRKNGVTSYDGVGQISVDAPVATNSVSVVTSPIDVIAGDFMETALFNAGDTSIDITAARSNFWCQVLG